jgi:hypothetical protein
MRLVAMLDLKAGSPLLPGVVADLSNDEQAKRAAGRSFRTRVTSPRTGYA